MLRNFIKNQNNNKMKKSTILYLFLLLPVLIFGQEILDKSKITIDDIYQSSDFYAKRPERMQWYGDGDSYTMLKYKTSSNFSLIKYDTKTNNPDTLIKSAELIPDGENNPLYIQSYKWSKDLNTILIFTNTARVWRYNTKGDYWIFNIETKILKKIGKTLPESSLMFAKFSPDNSQIAYVSKHNIYVENIDSGKITQLTFNGTDKIINGTFDWAYEEEFDCRDGFRWSPDGLSIAYWQIDATNIKNFLMINNTDSLYSFTIPVQYPKVGETPSSCKIGVVSLNGNHSTTWVDVPGDPFQNYIPRILWGENSDYLYAQQLNRKQNQVTIWKYNVQNNSISTLYSETETAWFEVVNDWQWSRKGDEFTWVSEKDEWKKLYLINKDSGADNMVTLGDYDMMQIEKIVQKGLYFIASPNNPVQRYLFYTPLKKNSKAKRITPMDEEGTHSYNISPNGKFAVHTWSTANMPPVYELIELPSHKVIKTITNNKALKKRWENLSHLPIEFFELEIEPEITMEGMMMLPPDFDSTKKYPVLFYVYGEPWTQTARDQWSFRNLYHLTLAQQGYIVITMDNRGTPCPKGREWRKSIYRKIGIINADDQAAATRKIQEWSFVDKDRIAVWGWSGGGSMTLNLMFRYPEIYKTGMAVAGVPNQLYYDNIYQERYMGLPSENLEDFVAGSPITYAKDLEGDLLIIHGTGDDNVHYQGTEALINELIEENKMFYVLPYPNRSHGIYEGKNTSRHLYNSLTKFLTDHIEAGGK